MAASTKPRAPRVSKWTDLTCDPAAPKIAAPRDQVIEFLEHYLLSALPRGCRIEVQWLMFESKEEERFRLKVRRGKHGYTYRLSFSKAALAYENLDADRRLDADVLAALREEADTLARRVWYCERAPLELVKQ